MSNNNNNKYILKIMGNKFIKKMINNSNNNNFSKMKMIFKINIMTNKTIVLVQSLKEKRVKKKKIVI